MFKLSKVSAAAVMAIGGLFALQALAQDATQRVEITGSSIKRVQNETSLPVQVLSRSEIESTGATNVEQLMQTIAAMSSSAGLTQSSASGATTGGISAISLRGLGSQRTLVLLNGRRIAPYGIGFTNDSVSVDVNSIPLAAVERVEVLKDGASAIYGSDAIAGVVNFILRKDFTGLELSAQYGGTSRGGASEKLASVIWGMGDLAKDKFSVMLMGSIQKQEPLFGKDRDFAARSYNVEKGNDTTSGNTFPANIAATDGSIGARNPTAATGCVAPYSFLDPQFPANRCRFDPASMVTLLPDTDRVSVFGSIKFALNSDTEAYAEASYTRNKSRTVIQPVPISDQFAIPPNNPLANQAPYNTYTAQPSSTIVLTSASAFYPTAYVQGLTGGPTPDLFIRYRAAVNGNRDITDISEAPRLVFGVRGVAGGWDYDTNALFSESKVREQVSNGYPVYSKILPLLNSGTVNFFGDNTDAINAQLRATNFTGDAFEVKSSISSLSAKVSRDGLVQLPGGGMGLALGGELRREGYDFRPSTELSTGDLSGYGGNFGAVNKTRSAYSLFGEINAPLAKGLEGNLALRYDHYSDVGSSVTPKASFKWQAANNMLVRGAWGRGFRAPGLGDLYTPQTTGVSSTGLSDPIRCPVTNDGIKDCATQFATLNGGLPTLRPEKSVNATLGIVLEPVANLSMAVDAFNIWLTNTISNGVPQAYVLSHLNQYGYLVSRGAVDPAFPALPGPISSINQVNLNLGATHAAGADFDVKWKIPAGDWGRFIYNLTGTYYWKFDIQNPDGTWSPTVGNLDQATTGGVIPRWRMYHALTWMGKEWEATGAFNWQSAYTDVPSSFTGDPNAVSTYKTVDAQVTYTGIKNLRLTLGARNLFDTDPPYSNQGFSFQSGYDPQYGDPRGRFIYLRANYAFK